MTSRSRNFTRLEMRKHKLNIGITTFTITLPRAILACDESFELARQGIEAQEPLETLRPESFGGSLESSPPHERISSLLLLLEWVVSSVYMADFD